MPLLFVPPLRRFVWWGEGPLPAALDLVWRGAARLERVDVLVPPGRRSSVEGVSFPVLHGLGVLAAVPANAEGLSPSLVAWSVAAKLALDLVVRGRVVPAVVTEAAGTSARWVAALSSVDDSERVAALGRAMPPACHALPADADATEATPADTLLRAFLDVAVDALVRGEDDEPDAAPSPPALAKKPAATASWDVRWLEALSSGRAAFDAVGFAERTLLGDLRGWSEPVLGSRDRLRACFRLELPAEGRSAFTLRYLLQAPDDPSLVCEAAEVWSSHAGALTKLGRAFREPEAALLVGLGRAARVFPPIARSLDEAQPTELALEADAASEFLSTAAPALLEAGFAVIVPSELTSTGERRLRLRVRVGGARASAARGEGALGLGDVYEFEWEAALGDRRVSASELDALAKMKSSLVRHRGEWIAVDKDELAEVRRRMAAGPGRLEVRDAVRAGLAGEIEEGGRRVAVLVEGALATSLGTLRDAATREATPPAGLSATLRPYQLRGLAWLRTLGSLGLGACLADDMGLGKTVQVLALLLSLPHDVEPDAKSARARAPAQRGRGANTTKAPRRGASAASPTLLVAPTSVVGNWEREVERFAKGLVIVRHYGAERARTVADLSKRCAGDARTIVLTTYGILRRDAALLAGATWSTVVLDEAQNIKNSASSTAAAARALRAPRRIALTGTPVENRLAELWSILEFANPGLLGTHERFRREHAIPIERYGDADAAARLRRMVSPFVLRRLKSDKAVIADLPAKNEMKVICSLTKEQASLYRAVVDEELRRIAEAAGIARRGRVLALLTSLKQICNHPAHYLGEGSLPRRSGKLERVTEMLDEALAAGDRALLFTQYREMGERLVAHLGETLGTEVVFLHGGVPKGKRDEMVRAFQEDAAGPRIFVLSIKAGGTGLNLTRASHVFHYDRWWNPAVEDQATDRAYRIGQKRAVQVHKLVCAGTVEEKIDAMLEQKRDLAEKVVGAGEQWITELGNAELRDLFSLSSGAVVDDDDEAPSSRARARGKAAPRPTRAREATP